MTNDKQLHDASLGEVDLIRSRQRARARITAVLLGGFVVLIFAISIVKIKMGLV